MPNIPRYLPCWLALAVALTGSFTAGATQEDDPAALRAVDSTHIDTTCSPCEDFFRFANGAWVDRTEIPARYTVYGVGREIEDRNEAILRRILDAAVRDAKFTADGDTRRVGLFYGTCMDSARANREGAIPLQASLRRIDGIRTRADLARTIGRLHRQRVNVAIRVFAAPDLAQSDTMRLHFYQGGIGLPDRDYYLRSDSAFVAARSAYRAHLQRLFVLLGLSRAAAHATANRVWSLEVALAVAALPAEEATKWSKLHHPTMRAELERIASHVEWERYFEALGTPGMPQLNVMIPSQLRAMDSLMVAAPLETWRAYLRARIAQNAAPYLGRRFEREHLALRQIISGQTELRPRWQRCLEVTDRAVGEALGAAYVREAFPPSAKERMSNLILNMKAVLRERIARLDWMSDSTKAAAVAKLDALGTKIGYPDRWRDYTKLDIANGPFLANMWAAERFESDRQLGRVNQLTDRSEWGMTPPTYNAYHNPSNNEIVFPAGALQPPLFDPAADDAVNYGATGAIIGHEMLHAFDDDGRHFDARGNLRDWWTAQDSAAFERKADVIVEQYNRYVVVDTLRVNGRLTLGENLADIGGLILAYEAWKRSLNEKPAPPSIGGFTPEQRFFLAYANSWREKVRPATERAWAVSDPHTAMRWRVNGVVGHLAAFAEAFNCPPNAPMVQPPDRRLAIW